MAARRLIALLVVLLVISSIAAALAPSPAEREDDTTSSTTTGSEEPGPARDAGELIAVTVDVPPPRDDSGKDGAEPETIGAAVGDQLALTVRTEDTAEIEIPELGLLETASPGGPARFDLLLREEGRLAVLAEGGRQVAWIVVRPGGSNPAETGPEGSADTPRPEP